MTGPRLIALLLSSLLLPTTTQAANFSAHLDWDRLTDLSSPLSARVASVPVQVGQRVDKQALLVRLDTRKFKAEQGRALAEVRRTRLLNEEAQRELQRANELYDRTVLSDHDRQKAEIAAAEAAASYRAAQAALESIRVDLDYSEIRAPFNARVLALPLASGSAAVAGCQAPLLARVAAADSMQALARIDDKQLTGLAKQQFEVGIRGQWRAAELIGVDPQPLEQTEKGASYRLRVRFAVKQGEQLFAGEPAAIRTRE